MGKNRGFINKLVALFLTTFGMALALPGCGKDVQTPQEMSQNVAQLTDDFVTALQNGDISEMKNIRDMVDNEKDKLLKEENRLIDKGEDATAVMQQRVLMENQETALSDVVTKFEEDQGVMPKNADLIGKIADGTGDAVGLVYDFLDGDPVYKTTAIITEYADNVDNAYIVLANSDKDLFEEWYGENFDEVQAAKGTYGPDITGTLEKFAFDAGKMAYRATEAFRKGWKTVENWVEDENAKNAQAAQEAREANKEAAKQEAAWKAFEDSK